MNPTTSNHLSGTNNKGFKDDGTEKPTPNWSICLYEIYKETQEDDVDGRSN